uniref:RING-type domain-containing protein n=1 Tax=Plectus sambesii TaxID=2011161 RepID=A0A914UN32_9BILA
MAQSPPPTASSSRIIKIFCTSRLSNGRPNKVGMEMVHIELTETNFSVGFINSKIQEKSDSYRDMVLCDSNGIPFPDDETTRQAAYWGFGRGQSSNAAKYFACKPREDDDESIYEGEPVPKKMSLSDGDIARVGATVRKYLSEDVKGPLKSTFTCAQCLGIALQPIVCIECAAIIACKRCIDLCVRMRTEEERDVTCPKCRAIWQRDEITDEVTGYRVAQKK